MQYMNKSIPVGLLHIHIGAHLANVHVGFQFNDIAKPGFGRLLCEYCDMYSSRYMSKYYQSVDGLGNVNPKVLMMLGWDAFNDRKQTNVGNMQSEHPNGYFTIYLIAIPKPVFVN